MTARKPARTTVTFRINPDGLARVDKAASLEGVVRSDMLRRLLALGLQHHKPSASEE